MTVEACRFLTVLLKICNRLSSSVHITSLAVDVSILVHIH